MVLAHAQTTSAARLASISATKLPPRDSAEKSYDFEIHDVRQSENAILFFNQEYVFKLLKPYDDARYHLERLSNRHACLVEGLYLNRNFTEDIQLGLARYCKLDRRRDKLSLFIGEIIKKPILEELDPDSEYVLVMRKLPQKYRLDYLLEEGNSFSHQYYEQVLTQFLWNIHANPSFPEIPIDSGEDWGSVTQIERKLKYNLAIVEKPGDDVKRKSVLRTEEYKQLLSTSKSLKNILLPIFSQETYQQYFQQRREKRQIKRCHGDLKARNIWIFPSASNKKVNLWEGVRVLDAIDFNPDFCFIDTLSDFAMLVADIRVRTNQQNLANHMVESYLRRTNQLDQPDRFVLAYYLVEKAFIGACVSIMYDDQPTLGLRYLEATGSYLDELRRLKRD